MELWKQEKQYGWTHPSGWHIGQYVVGGTPVFTLWHGEQTHGRFDDLEAAQRRHMALLAAPDNVGGCRASGN